MADITVTAVQVAPLTENGAIIRDYAAGGTLTVGNVVYVDSSGTVQAADGSAAGTAWGIGIVCDTYDGTTTAASGETVPVCIFGPVSGFSSATPGTKGWVSDTAGALADAAGTVGHEVGYFESAGVFFVNPDPAGPGS